MKAEAALHADHTCAQGEQTPCPPTCSGSPHDGYNPCNAVKTRKFAAICFQRILWINKFGRLTGYSLVLVHYIGTGKLWGIKRFGG